VGEGSDGTVPQQGSIAVIIPVYNGEKFIRRALDSVMRQTLAPAEIFVVDDGSKDPTREIVANEYGGRVTLIQQQNGGPAKARNAALRVATSEFVAFLDADDWWEPAKLERQYAAMLKHPEAVAHYTAVYRVSEIDGSSFPEVLPAPERLEKLLQYCNPGIPPASVMARRDAVLKAGGFNERQQGSEDWCLWFGLRKLGPLISSAEPLTDYRVSAGGLSGNGDHMFKDAMKMVDDVLLRELSGLDRMLWRRRIIAYQAYKACLTSRAAGNKADERKYMKTSLVTWPSPLWAPERFKAFAVTLLRS
jgi:glycosyltransferase involved in cell wall biosynthesis